MTPDWLEQATRAAREVGHASPVESARTRTRILESAASRSARRPVRTLWVGLAAAALLGGSASAAGAKRVGLATWLGLAPTTGDERDVASAPPPRSHAQAVVPAPVNVVAMAPREEPVPALRSVPEPKRSPAPAATRPVEALSLYEEAHALHFRAHDYARALDAWSRYLAVAPGGSRDGLALEARYNHAICLVRLGRRSEARTELEAFAEGMWGGYRQEDARALLGGLDEP